MARATIILNSQADRDKAGLWASKLPLGTRIEFKETKRTIPQNDLLWACLTEISRKSTLHGKRYNAEQWKIIFMGSIGQEMKFLPTVDGQSFIPIGHSSSDLSKSEMSDLIEFIYAYCAENEVHLSSKVQKDTEAESSQASGDDDGAEGGSLAPSSELLAATKALFQYGKDAENDTEENRPEYRGRFKSLVPARKKLVPEHEHDQLEAIVKAVDAVIKGEQDYETSVGFFAEAMGFDPETFEINE